MSDDPATVSPSQARRNAHIAICKSKLRFERKKDAKLKCKLVISHGGDPRVRPYLCIVCAGWHLTRNKDYSRRKNHQPKTT